MNQIQSIVASILHDYAPSMDSWKQHNCPACIHRGQPRPDTRRRGNHRFNSDGSFAYNCYNCHCKIGWSPGRFISKDFENLLTYFGASHDDVLVLKDVAKAMVESGDYTFEDTTATKIYQKIEKRKLPPNTKTFAEWISTPNPPPEFIKVLEEVYNRNQYILDLDIMWSPDKEFQMYNRFILPYRMNSEIIGYTARHKVHDTKYRYYNQVSTDVFYNFDLLNDPRVKYILVAEGPIDAALMGGIGSNNYFMSKNQIKTLTAAQDSGKVIVVVPDRDKNGIDAIEQAIKHGFSVSLPDYGSVRTQDGIRRIKDFDEASSKHGRLFCLQMLYDSIYTDPFDIRSKMDMWL